MDEIFGMQWRWFIFLKEKLTFFRDFEGRDEECAHCVIFALVLCTIRVVHETNMTSQ